MQKVLRVRGLRVRYAGGDWVLKGLNFELGKGEVVLIIGESGSGKTTFVRAITGLAGRVYNAVVEGYIEISGKPLAEWGWEEVRDKIGVVLQNPRATLVYPIVYDDLISHAYSIYGSADSAERALSNATKLLRISHLLNKHVDQLSGGELRRVSIAKALLSNPEVIVLDEPLMWLDDKGMEEVRKTIEILKLHEISVVVLEHRYRSLVEVADRMLRLESGVLAPIESPLEVGGGFTTLKQAATTQEERDPVLEVRNVEVKVGELVLKDISLRISRGEKVVIYGGNGSGKTTLLRVITGVIKPAKGVVKRRGGILYIPQIPYLYFTESSLVDELKLAGLPDAGKASTGKTRFDLDRSPFSLSWGEALEFIVEMALESRSELVLMDEPFSGLSYTSRKTLGGRLLASPKAVVVTASNRENLEFLAGFKLLELKEGRLVEKGLLGDLR
jgi:energy-coupling factor transport system ATP-binding protein